MTAPSPDPTADPLPSAPTPVFPPTARKAEGSDGIPPFSGPIAHPPEARHRQAEPTRLNLNPTVIERLVVEKIIQPPRVAQPGQGFQPRAVAMPGPASAGTDRTPPPAGPASAPVLTIHVSIGRVEIRAAHPVAAPPRPKPAGPAPMSLDDYLRRRNGGGR